MKVVTLASGSKGNCTYIKSKEANILIDLGVSARQIENNLKYLGENPENIDAILITHEHSDHIKGVLVFAKKYNTKVYAYHKAWGKLLTKIGDLDLNLQVDFFDADFYIKDITVSPFEVSHDSEYCFGYSFYNNGKKVSIATDLGHTNDRIIESLKNSALVILESNHDENILLNNPKYPFFTRKRILSNKGHLSNTASANVIAKLIEHGTKQVVLAHLSDENNAPELAFNTVKQELAKMGIIEGEHVFIDVAPAKQIGNIFDVE